MNQNKKYPNDLRSDSIIDKERQMKDIHNDTLEQSEDALQQKCIFWFHNDYSNLRGLLFSVPNGGARTSKEGKRMKLTGVVPGVSDLILLYKTQTYLIELKIKRGNQSSVQKNWQEKVECQGFNYFIITSLTEFRRLINQLIVI